MLKSGYTKKLIEQFEAALREISDLKIENKPEEALDVIQNAFSSMFRLNSMFFDSVPIENLLDILKVNGVIERDKAIIISKLLEEEAEIYEKMDKLNEGFYIYVKSLNLFLEAFLCDREAELTSYLADIDIIFNKVSDYKLPNGVLIDLIKYFEQKGLYDSGEDMVYEFLDNTHNSSEAIETGIDFYRNLQNKSDEELENGNLPREEVEDALLKLTEMLNA
jgi:hypothetical protein